jgi:hypothetical protein
LLQSEAPELQVYEHVVPLHEGAEALVGVHTSPHALQLLVVFRVVQSLPPHRVSLQVHDPLTQLGVGCAQVAWLTQLPVAPQV